MATTTNLGLYKPTRDDYISVTRDLSDNYDLIDAAVGQNNELLDDMDIVINGNTSSVNVTSGQFVTVRNSTIAGITDGIYRAKSNVSSGTAFTSSNLEQVTGGALNSLNDKFSYHVLTATGATPVTLPSNARDIIVVAAYGTSNGEQNMRFLFPISTISAASLNGTPTQGYYLNPNTFGFCQLSVNVINYTIKIQLLNISGVDYTSTSNIYVHYKL